MKSVKKLLCCLIPAKSKGIIKIETKKRYNYEAPGSSLFMYKEDEATASPYEKEWYICEAPRRTSLFMFTSIEEAASPAASPYDDLSSCSSHEVEDGTDDEARVGFDPVSVSTRARYTYALDKIAMLKSRFGEFRFETDVHVDQSVEEMKSALEECKFLYFVNKNTQLKNQLGEFDIQYHDTYEQLVQMQAKMDSFEDCSVHYEQALRRIDDLESELTEAHRDIHELQIECERHQAAETDSLYDELMGKSLYEGMICSNSSSPAASHSQSVISTIDLTKDDSTTSCYLVSNKTLKKYIKVKKFIRRTQKYINAKHGLQKMYI
ncbi:hypothetical protein MSG28_010024 [Choristoneura fumiferana]|uniref:Uncharacterized protein n=1 Tax=Choristoneura fumiferana TaxID=7141 RepID=A0ACC0KK32_CHOFU|nr:hypothetical protein MSG28_010024 [Choristoneura fumiferana]